MQEPAAAAASLAAGLTLGFYAGISPGPLFTLVVSETLRNGIRAGFLVAAAPLITDLPIVALSVILLAALPDAGPVLGLLSIAGGLYLIHLGLHGIRFSGDSRDTPPAPATGSLFRGVAANFTNPSPYLFWGTVGGPLLLSTWRASPAAAVAFLIGFYGLLVGSKCALALASGHSRKFLKNRAYTWTLRTLGALLLAFAALFLYRGVTALF